MAKRVSFSAMAMALSVICLYAASAFSTGKLAALGLASLFCAICVSLFGVRYGLAQYVGTSLLALLLIPNRFFVLVYILFAGYYPVVKLYIEKLDKLWAEWLLKYVFFNVILIGLYLIANFFFLPYVEAATLIFVFRYLALIIVALQVVFFLFDWVLSYMIGYYNQYLRRMLHV